MSVLKLIKERGFEGVFLVVTWEKKLQVVVVCGYTLSECQGRADKGVVKAVTGEGRQLWIINEIHTVSSDFNNRGGTV